MEEHQYKLLEGIYYNENQEITSYQRLGDNNQAIYSYEISRESVWEARENIHVINGSNRLTELNAKLASRFSLDGCVVDGLNTIDNEYKPVLVIYDADKTECNVIEQFSKYLDGKLKKDPIYKVVSWRWFNKDKNKISLSSYCPNYESMKTNIDNSIAENEISKDYYETAQLIINTIVGKLNDIGYKIDNNHISKFTLINYLKELGDEQYTMYMDHLYFSTQMILRREYEAFYRQFNDYCDHLGKLLNISKKNREELAVSEGDFGSNQDIVLQKCQKCNVMGVSPLMGSVHSVKGETHDATLFLESFYNRNYECDILHEVLCGEKLVDILKGYKDKARKLEEEISEIEDKGNARGIDKRRKDIKSLESKITNSKQYAKIVYVALTRAKVVVGYGVSKEKYNKYLKDNIDTEEWHILLIE